MYLLFVLDKQRRLVAYLDGLYPNGDAAQPAKVNALPLTLLALITLSRALRRDAHLHSVPTHVSRGTMYESFQLLRDA
jgi:hypothetical protein